MSVVVGAVVDQRCPPGQPGDKVDCVRQARDEHRLVKTKARQVAGNDRREQTLAEPIGRAPTG